MDPRREAVLDPDVGVARAPDRQTTEEIELLSFVEPATLQRDQPSVVFSAALAGKRMEAGRLGRGPARAPKLAQSAAGNPEQEQVEDG